MHRELHGVFVQGRPLLRIQRVDLIPGEVVGERYRFGDCGSRRRPRELLLLLRSFSVKLPV